MAAVICREFGAEAAEQLAWCDTALKAADSNPQVREQIDDRGDYTVESASSAGGHLTVTVTRADGEVIQSTLEP